MDDTSPLPFPENLSIAERVERAADAFFARRSREQHPEGAYVEGLWYPAPSERRACCADIEPSLVNRQALESHCRTQVHVAELYEVPIDDLRTAIRARRSAEEVAQRPARRATPKALYETTLRTRSQGLENLRDVVQAELPRLMRLAKLDEEGLLNRLDDSVKSAEHVLTALQLVKNLELVLHATLRNLEGYSRSARRPAADPFDDEDLDDGEMLRAG